jgi:hypothetical protein
MNMRLSAIAYILAATSLISISRAADAPATQPSTQPVATGVVVAYDGDPLQSDVVTSRLENAGTRSPNQQNLEVFCWSSQGGGVTTQARPTLVWHMNEPTQLPIKILLTDPKQHTTIHLWESSGQVPAGIHVLDTSKANYELAPGAIYKWTVRVVNDPTNPDQDLYSCGYIRRVPSTDAAAMGHSFYDAAASIATQLPQNTDSAKAAAANLLQKVDLNVPKNMTVTNDQAIAQTP